MGGGFYSKYDQSFDSKDWQEIGQDECQQYVIVKNKITGQLLDRYYVQCANEKQYQKYMISVNFRRNEDNIIRIIHYEPKIIKQFCGSSYILNVYLQHCKSRLSEYEDIPSPDYLYCAMSMINGFEKLYKKIGRFYISSNSVMIDEMGKIRVWINENFSENQAQDIKQINGNREEKNEQYQMVNDIITIILQNIDEQNEQYKVKFKQFYLEKRMVFNQKIGFVQCKNIIYQFCRINNIQIPNIFNAVLNLYQQQKVKTIQNQQLGRKHFNSHVIPIDVNKEHQITRKNGDNAIQNNGNRVASPQINQLVISEPFIRGTSLPLTIQPGRNNAVLETSNFINNRNTAPIYLPSSHSGLRVTTPISPLPVKGPPSPSHNMINYPLTSSIQLSNVSHNFINKPQVITTNSRVGPPPPLVLNSFIPINNNTINNNAINNNTINSNIINKNIINSTINNNNLKQNNEYKMPLKPINNKKIIISSSCPLTLINNKLQNNNKNNKQIIKYNNKYNEKKKIQLCQQQLQIQKNFILKDNNHINNNDQNIIQSNIIKQLSQLHKIQQKQKFKQKQIYIQSINSKNQFYYHNHLNKQQCQISNQQSSINRIDSPIYYQNLSSARSSVQNDHHFFQAPQKVIFNSEQQQQKNNFNQPSFTPIPSKQFPIQYSNRYTPQVNKQIPQQNQIQNVFKKGGENLPYNENLSSSTINRQFYYTLHDQVQLDPQIVNDLSLYVQS